MPVRRKAPLRVGACDLRLQQRVPGVPSVEATARGDVEGPPGEDERPSAEEGAIGVAEQPSERVVGCIHREAEELRGTAY